MREYKICGILGGNPPAEPRIENRKCSLDETRGKNRTDLPINPKWQIGPFVVAESPIEGVAACRRGSEASPSGGLGAQPRRAFGDFPRDGKVTRVPSMAKPCSRGAPAGGCRDCCPVKAPGARGGAPAHGEECRGGHQPSSHERKAARSAPPLRKSRSFIKIYNLFISLLHLCYIMKRTKELSCPVWESLLELKAVRR